MNYILAAILLAVSVWLLWEQRPKAHWRGDAAACFMAASIAALLALWELQPFGQWDGGLLIVKQLTLFAAVPMLISVLLAQSVGYNWSRMIWGRILLGWCVVFELARHNNALELIGQIIVGVGLIAIALAVIKHLRYTLIAQVAVITSLSYLILIKFS